MADKSFVLGQLLKVVHGGKIIVILIKTSPGLGGALSQSVWSSGLKEVSNRRC